MVAQFISFFSQLAALGAQERKRTNVVTQLSRLLLNALSMYIYKERERKTEKANVVIVICSLVSVGAAITLSNC